MKVVILQIVRKVLHLIHGWILSVRRTTRTDKASIKFFIKHKSAGSRNNNSSKEVKDEEKENNVQLICKEEQN